MTELFAVVQPNYGVLRHFTQPCILYHPDDVEVSSSFLAHFISNGSRGRVLVDAGHLQVAASVVNDLVFDYLYHRPCNRNGLPLSSSGQMAPQAVPIVRGHTTGKEYYNVNNPYEFNALLPH